MSSSPGSSSTVKPTNYIEGYLKKAGELNPSAKPRYFQLWVDPPVFSYFKNAGGQLIKTVRLQGPSDEVIVDYSNPLGFVLNTKDRNWNLYANTETQRDVWVDIFRRACHVSNMAQSSLAAESSSASAAKRMNLTVLRVKVPTVIETEGMVYFHCVAEAEHGIGQ